MLCMQNDDVVHPKGCLKRNAMIYVQTRPGAPLGYEESLVWQYATMERLNVRGFAPAEMQSQDISVDDAQLVVGSVESIAAALNKLGKKLPKPNYYPQPLQPWLYRKLSQSTAQIARWRIEQGESLFVKSNQYKVMTGTVCTSSHHNPELHSISNEAEVWVGDVVDWVCEYRLYIIKHEVVACAIYAGDESVTLDSDVINNALKAMKQYDWHDTYTMDWGVIRQPDGSLKTALVEVNDAWAIGAYKGIGYRDYFQLLKRRWGQLTQ